MTTTIPSEPPASSTKRPRITRSRTLSSAPPMIMTEPSDPWRLEVLEGTLRGSLPNDRPGVGLPRWSRVPSAGRGHLRGEALRARSRVDAAQEDGGQDEERDARRKGDPRPDGLQVHAADDVDEWSHDQAGQGARRGDGDVA